MDTWVKAGEYGWVNVEDVDFEDISEGPYGDLMTFYYKSEIFTSVIVNGSKP